MLELYSGYISASEEGQLRQAEYDIGWLIDLRLHPTNINLSARRWVVIGINSDSMGD
jgi:hypothetical protein